MSIQFLQNKNKYAIFTAVFLSLSLMGGIFLVQQSQDLRNRATEPVPTTSAAEPICPKFDCPLGQTCSFDFNFLDQCPNGIQNLNVQAHDHGDDFDANLKFFTADNQLVKDETVSIETTSQNVTDICREEAIPFTPHNESDSACYETSLTRSFSCPDKVTKLKLELSEGEYTASHIHLCYQPVCCPAIPTSTPTPTPSLPPANISCLSCLTYNQNWQQITNLNNLKIGESVYFAVTGSGEVVKGRFKVTINGNAGNWQESNQKNTSDKFYFPYLVQQAGAHQVNCEVYSPSSGWR